MENAPHQHNKQIIPIVTLNCRFDWVNKFHAI